MDELRVNGRTFKFSTFDGVVIAARHQSATRVSGSTSGYAGYGSGSVSGSINSWVERDTDLFVADAEGRECRFHFGFDVPVRNGQRVTVVVVDLGRDWMPIALVNHDTGDRFWYKELRAIPAMGKLRLIGYVYFLLTMAHFANLLPPGLHHLLLLPPHEVESGSGLAYLRNAFFLAIFIWIMVGATRKEGQKRYRRFIDACTADLAERGLNEHHVWQLGISEGAG